MTDAYPRDENAIPEVSRRLAAKAGSAPIG
jgi:hypothetical protein